MEKKRINKYISEVGFCSRRKADEYISAGRVYINGSKALLGSNKGNRSGLINEAIDKIDIIIGKVMLKSSIYDTKSWGFNSNNFYNICILVESELWAEWLEDVM